MYETGRKKPRPLHSKKRAGRWSRNTQTLILLTLTTGLIATGGFGLFPANPLSDGVRGFISENYPALVLRPINSMLQDIAVATLPSQNETASEVTSLPVQWGSEAGVVGLSGAAGAVSSSTSTSVPTETFTPTFMPTGTFTFTPTVTMTPTVSITPAAQTCLTLTTPANGTVLPTQGNVLFSWSAMPSAAKYEIVFTLPDKTWSKYTLTGTAYNFPIGTLIRGGTYTWTVSAYDAAGKLLCTALEFKFKKDVSSTPTPTSTLTLVPTNTPSGTGTVLPPTDTYTGAGNTIFSAASGPSGTVTDCATGVSFSVTVTDPDGVNWVSVEYYWTGGDGPTSLSLGYNGADSWSTVTGPLSSGDYSYSFLAKDNLGNYQMGLGGSFTCP